MCPLFANSFLCENLVPFFFFSFSFDIGKILLQLKKENSFKKSKNNERQQEKIKEENQDILITQAHLPLH